MNLSVSTLGVDIAKLKFDVCLIKENGKTKHKVFDNTNTGSSKLARGSIRIESPICTSVLKRPALMAKH